MELRNRNMFLLLILVFAIIFSSYYISYKKGKSEQIEIEGQIYSIIDNCKTWEEFMYRKDELTNLLTDYEKDEVNKLIEELEVGWRKSGEENTLLDKRYMYKDVKVKENGTSEFYFKYERLVKYARYSRIITIFPYITYLFNCRNGLPILIVTIKPNEVLDMDVKNKFKIIIHSNNKFIN